MKYLILLFTFILSSQSCETKKQNRKSIPSNIIIGEWVNTSNKTLESEIGHNLFILDNGDIYGFNHTLGGSLIFKGYFLEKYSFSDSRKNKYKIEVLDSASIIISNSKIEDGIDTFNLSILTDEYETNIIQKLKGDSIRNNIIGRWELIESSQPFRLPNSRLRIEKVLMNIKEDGFIDFELEKDSIFMKYKYIMDGEDITLLNGCIMGKIKEVTLTKNDRIDLLLEEKPMLFSKLAFKRIN